MSESQDYWYGVKCYSDGAPKPGPDSEREVVRGYYAAKNEHFKAIRSDSLIIVDTVDEYRQQQLRAKGFTW